MPLDATTGSADPAEPSDEAASRDPGLTGRTGVHDRPDRPDGGAGSTLVGDGGRRERAGGGAGDGGSGGEDGVDVDVAGRGEGPAGRSSRAGRVAAIVVVASLVAMWGYVVYLAFGPGRQPPVDRLDDPAFARAAEDRCGAALDDVDGLPLAQDSPTPRARAEVLAQANTAFTVMLEDLRGLARLAPAGDQRERVRAWLTDWETYLNDRVRYAEDLRTDPSARFLISEKPGTGRHITGWIDEFAKANRMPSCATPTDV